MRFVWVRVEYPGIGTDCCCSHRRGCCGRLIPSLQSNCCGRHSDGAYSLLLLSSLLPILILSNLPYAASHQVVYPVYFRRLAAVLVPALHTGSC